MPWNHRSISIEQWTNIKVRNYFFTLINQTLLYSIIKQSKASPFPYLVLHFSLREKNLTNFIVIVYSERQTYYLFAVTCLISKIFLEHSNAYTVPKKREEAQELEVNNVSVKWYASSNRAKEANRKKLAKK